MSGDRRQKASDVFRGANLLLGRKVTFAEAFPEVANMTVQVTETIAGSGGTPQRFGIGSVGEYVDCTNPLCYNGGFRIGGVIRDMVSKRETSREGSDLCQGYEGSPKGRKNYGPCDRYFKWVISLQYAPENDDQ